MESSNIEFLGVEIIAVGAVDIEVVVVVVEPFFQVWINVQLLIRAAGFHARDGLIVPVNDVTVVGSANGGRASCTGCRLGMESLFIHEDNIIIVKVCNEAELLTILVIIHIKTKEQQVVLSA